MGLSWFECLIYGFISGLSEFLPISSLAHQTVYLNLIGGEDHYLLRLSAHLGALFALLLVFAPALSRYRRERRIARMPKNRRRRHPDVATMLEFRLLRTAAIFMLIVFVGYRWVYNLNERLWLLALLLGVNGIILYLPQYLPGANKKAESMSSLDGMLIGITAGARIIPGLSGVGCGTSCAMIRGTDRQFSADISLLLSIPALIVLAVLDCVFPVGNVAVSGWLIFCCITATAASFGAAYLAIFAIRFLSVKTGFSGFAYYSWGLALFSLIIYLI